MPLEYSELLSFDEQPVPMKEMRAKVGLGILTALLLRQWRGCRRLSLFEMESSGPATGTRPTLRLSLYCASLNSLLSRRRITTPGPAMAGRGRPRRRGRVPTRALPTHRA